METLFSLTSAGNTDNPSLFILRTKGYQLEVSASNESSHYVARKDGRSFLGHSGTELLGLITLWENLGDNWRARASSMPNILDEVTREDDKD